MIGTPAGLTRVHSSGSRPISAAGIRQEFEGHGVAVPPTLVRGYMDGPTRPASAAPASRGEQEGAGAAAPATAARSRRSRKPARRLLIHVHLREKVLPISAGEGKQCVFWLGIQGVQRYVTDPDSYTRPYSEELTPRGVLAEDGSWIDTTARIADELQDGDHVWVDVGDGKPLSEVLSRTFAAPKYQPAQEDAEEEIEWEEDPEDHHKRMSYHRVGLNRERSTFLQWKAQVESREEDLWGTFVSNWEQIRMVDLPGAQDYKEEVKGVLWKHFEQIAYLFQTYASKGSTGAAGNSGLGLFTMSLQEFWGFCKDCSIPSPYLNLAKIDLLFITIDSKYKSSPHNPSRAFVLCEFMEGLVRLSVLKQKGTKDATDSGMTLPDCLEDMMQNHVLKFGLSDHDFHSAARRSLETQMVRRVIKLHATAMRKVFRKWAKADKTKETIELSEFAEMMKLSGVMDKEGAANLREVREGGGPGLGRKQVADAFVLAQLDDGLAEGWRNAKDPCTQLIFPEFMEAIGRVSLCKYKADTISTTERKLHEVCQLIIASPAGCPKAHAAAQDAAAARAGGSPHGDRHGRRRGPTLMETAGHSMHSMLKYKPDGSADV